VILPPSDAIDIAIDARAFPQHGLLIERLAVRVDDRLHRLARGRCIAMNQ
jgi:hypothetical protein